jgi:hypothetical protein
MYVRKYRNHRKTGNFVIRRTLDRCPGQAQDHSPGLPLGESACPARGKPELGYGQGQAPESGVFRYFLDSGSVIPDKIRDRNDEKRNWGKPSIERLHYSPVFSVYIIPMP